MYDIIVINEITNPSSKTKPTVFAIVFAWLIISNEIDTPKLSDIIDITRMNVIPCQDVITFFIFKYRYFKLAVQIIS
jgi:hypothetical protein